MKRFVVMRLLLAAMVVLMVGTVWVAAQLQSSADDTTERELVAHRELIVAMLDQETGVRGYANIGRPDFLEPYLEGRQNFERALATARENTKDATDTRLVTEAERVARAWQERAALRVDEIRRGGRRSDFRDAAKRKELMDEFRQVNAKSIAYLRARRADERTDAQTVTIAMLSALGLLFFAAGWLLVERPVRRESRSTDRLAEFTAAMQVARSEEEAYRILRRHLERWLHGAHATVFTRNASANRLQAATPVGETSDLAAKLADAVPESCLAVRRAGTYTRGPADQPLMACEICGELPGYSACMPSIVGGEVVGSVLVETPDPVDAQDRRDAAATVASAGPVVANLRNLAIAEVRAATDPLTRLPNRRAAADTLKRMVAQALRTKAPLAAVSLDLDHFKQVNDVYGHPMGDEVLAAVGTLLANTLRDSDFAGRLGGEEFLVLLPDTDGPGAITAAEKLRAAIEGMQLSLPEGVSASFGVAVLPTHAVDAEGLLRAADRALYAAKNAGRNRVEVVESS